jgi:hypothetical protein
VNGEVIENSVAEAAALSPFGREQFCVDGCVRQFVLWENCVGAFPIPSISSAVEFAIPNFADSEADCRAKERKDRPRFCEKGLRFEKNAALSIFQAGRKDRQIWPSGLACVWERKNERKKEMKQNSPEKKGKRATVWRAHSWRKNGFRWRGRSATLKEGKNERMKGLDIFSKIQ